MLVLLSPSKTMDFESKNDLKKFTLPPFLEDSEFLINQLRRLDMSEIMEMMKVSEKIAQLNFDRYKKWSLPFNLKNARQAILAFKGDVYKDIDVENYTVEDMEFAQDTIRIISGLYGWLRPLDLMQPYRLEMKYKTNFWKKKLTAFVSEELKKKPQTIVNLASKEYSSALDFSVINQPVVSPVFKEKKADKYKIIALYAKIARGTMANWIVKNRIKKTSDLSLFSVDGYRYSVEDSNEKELVFLRG